MEFWGWVLLTFALLVLAETAVCCVLQRHAIMDAVGTGKRRQAASSYAAHDAPGGGDGATAVPMEDLKASGLGPAAPAPSSIGGVDLAPYSPRELDRGPAPAVPMHDDL